VYVALGDELNEKENFAQAMTLYKKALSIDTTNTDALEKVGSLVINVQKSDEMLAKMEAEIEQNPNDADRLLSYGEILMQRDNLYKAREVFEKVEELNPEINQVYEYLGNLNFELEDFDKSQDYYLKYLEKNPKNADILLKVAQIYKDKKQTADAQKYYLKVLDIDKENKYALINLAVISVGQKNNIKAKEYLNKLIKVYPEYPQSYYLLGAILDNQKDYKNALRNYEIFMKRAPDDKNYASVKSRVDLIKKYVNSKNGKGYVNKKDI
jgi:tetratricopeptide (TPR) repeat protein